MSITNDMDTMNERTVEIEKSFSYDGYQIVRREMFAHLREPSVVIRKDSITFNTACINGLEDAIFIQVMINRGQHRMAIRKCGENDKDSLRWCIAKMDKRKSRKITSKEFSRKIYDLMDWSEKCRYKILGHRIHFGDDILYVFELDDTEIVFERKKKTVAQAVEETGKETLTSAQIEERRREEENMPVKPFYPDDWDNSFGIPVYDHSNVTLDSTVNYQSFSNIKGEEKGESVDG